MTDPSRAEHRFFIITLVAKGLLGLTQLLIAAAIYFGTVERVPGILRTLFRRELAEDPNDFLARQIMTIIHHLPDAGVSFYTVYFAAHGLLHVAVVAALFSGANWAHRAAIWTLVAFVVYQLVEWSMGGGMMLIVLTLIDLVVIVLTLRDEKAHKRAAHAVRPGGATNAH